jgi:hypothetical protein
MACSPPTPTPEQASDIPGTVVYASKTNLLGKLGDRFTLDSDDLWLVSESPGNVAIDHPNSRLFTVHQAYILDGNFTVTTRGDMLVKDVPFARTRAITRSA